MPPLDIRLDVPADTRCLRTLRLAIAGAAELAGFDEEAVGDVRIAVDELAAAVMSVADGGARLIADVEVGRGRLRVVGRLTRPPGSTPQLSPIAQDVLPRTTDHHWLGARGTFGLERVTATPTTP
ncbi:hypothetical protein [Egicoccus sp. AB-alg2]|uniref:hypothetical protein n=1 Tax=Egicoccus sp. AB-alg2 TaxID=3242693 RepID=UPI00359EDC18